MKMLCFIIVLFAYSSILGQNTNPDIIKGQWITEEGKSVVEIFKQDGKFYGKVLWLKDPNDANGKPLKDVKNSDPKLRDNYILNMVFLKDFEFDSKNNIWKNGTVYDPESGNTYKATIKVKTEDILELRGFVGVSMLGRSSFFVRKKNN